MIRLDGSSVSSINRANNGFPFLDILGYLKNTHKNPKFGKVRQVPIRELGWEFPGCGICLTLPKLGFLWVFFKYPKIPKNGNPLFFPVKAEMTKRKTLRRSNLAIQAYGSHIFLRSYLRYIGIDSRPLCRYRFLAVSPLCIWS